MKIRWHWGTGIVVALSLFILLILGFVFRMFYVDFHLVEKDYYPKELNYQEHMRKEQNAKKLNEKVHLIQADKYIVTRFPEIFKGKKVQGKIWFYNVVNEKYDKEFPIELDSTNTARFLIHQFVKGRYKVKIDYRVDTTSYYQELSITLN